jgi:hypothetical protein
VGIGALALVRPWGLRLPRWLVIVPALAGSVFAMGHALTAYVTKPLHLLGVVELEFPGWKTRDEGATIAWDLLFYEPWFLALGLLVTARHPAPPSPHRRVGHRPAAPDRAHRRRDGRAHDVRHRFAGVSATGSRSPSCGRAGRSARGSRRR